MPTGSAWWTSTVDYPLNIGGKPFNSWPAFIPVIFETTILFAAFSAGLGMLALNRFPEPYHPVFNVERFRENASREGFFLCIEASDPKFDRQSTRAFLEGSLPHINRLLRESVDEAVADAEVVVIGHDDERFARDAEWQAQGKLVHRLV